MNGSSDSNLEGVAIVGLAGRFPGARNTDEFWKNLENGVESIRVFTEEELRQAGQETAGGDFVRARSVLDDVDLFDAPLLRHRQARGRTHGPAAPRLPGGGLGGAGERGLRPAALCRAPSGFSPG